MVKFINKAKQSKGFSVLEVLISISIITVGILSISNLFLAVTKSSIESKNKLIATYLAEENIEAVRRIRDANWLNGGPSDWDDDIDNGDVVMVPVDNYDIRKGFEIVNSNNNRIEVYEDQTGGGYFQSKAQGLRPPSWKLTGFKRWIVIIKPDNSTMRIDSHVEYKGKELANVTAILKNWRN